MSRAPWIPLLVTFALASCASPPGQYVESTATSTSWLLECNTDAECGAAFACMCGRCTVPCRQDVDCAAMQGAVCRVPEGSCEAATLTCQAASGASGSMPANAVAGARRPESMEGATASASSTSGAEQAGIDTPATLPTETTGGATPIGSVLEATVPTEPTEPTDPTTLVPGTTPSEPYPTRPLPSEPQCVAEGAEDWSVHGMPERGHTFQVATDVNGDVFTAGSITEEGVKGSRTLLVKYSGADGAILWSTLGAPSEGSSRAHDVVVDASGSAYAVGYTEPVVNPATGSDGDAFLTKYSWDGREQWSRIVSDVGYSDVAVKVIVDGAGDVVVLGQSTLSASGAEMFLAKYSVSGDEMWTVRMGSGEGYTTAGDVVSDSAGTLTIAGYTDESLEGEQQGYGDAFVAQLSKEGTLQWVRQYGTDRQDSMGSIELDAEGSFFVAGYSSLEMAPPGEGGPFLAKLSPAGDVVWKVERPRNTEDSISDLELDDCGNLAVSGLLVEYDDVGRTTDINALVAAYSPNGELLWEKTVGGPEQNYGQGIATDVWGNVYLAGWEWDADAQVGGTFVTRYR